MNKRLKLKTIATILEANINTARFYNDKFKIDLDEVRTLSGRELGNVATKSLVNRLRKIVPDVSVDVNDNYLFITAFDGATTSTVSDFEDCFSENPTLDDEIEVGRAVISDGEAVISQDVVTALGGEQEIAFLKQAFKDNGLGFASPMESFSVIA